MSAIPDAEKIKRFDTAFKLLSDLAYKAPEVRPPNGHTVEALGLLICDGTDPSWVMK